MALLTVYSLLTKVHNIILLGHNHYYTVFTYPLINHCFPTSSFNVTVLLNTIYKYGQV